MVIKRINCESFEEWAKEMSLDPDSKTTEELFNDWVAWCGKYLMISACQDVFKNKTTPDMNGPKHMTVVSHDD